MPIFGPFTGALDNSGETIRLGKPSPPLSDLTVPYVSVDHVNYGTEGDWPTKAAGDGYSLNRRVNTNYGNDSGNWATSNLGGTPGLANAFVSISNVSRAEGNAGTQQFTFNVTLSAASSSVVTVTYATANGTATAGSDYTTASGTLTFQPGITSLPINVTVSGDTTTPEPNEIFLVNLTAATGAIISTGQGVGTILNDDTPAVVGRYVFYNNSSFDGNNLAAGSADDAAIATDKTPLLPGSKATFANYTSYSRGINGIMIDVAKLPTATNPTAADFTFRTGNTSTPGGWALLSTQPTVTIRRGAGAGGSDRIELTWPDGTIKKTWLQVTVLANVRTGLTTADTFYFGNAVGESGDSATNAMNNATDEIGVRNNPRTFDNLAPITFAYDYNRDGFVNAIDQVIGRSNTTNGSNVLNLITIPVSFSESTAIEPLFAMAAASESLAAESMAASAVTAMPQAAPVGSDASSGADDRLARPSSDASLLVGPLPASRAAAALAISQFDMLAEKSDGLTFESFADEHDDTDHLDSDLLELLAGPRK